MRTWRGFLLGVAAAMLLQNIVALARGGSFKFTTSPLTLSLWIVLVLVWSVSIAVNAEER